MCPVSSRNRYKFLDVTALPPLELVLGAAGDLAEAPKLLAGLAGLLEGARASLALAWARGHWLRGWGRNDRAVAALETLAILAVAAFRDLTPETDKGRASTDLVRAAFGTLLRQALAGTRARANGGTDIGLDFNGEGHSR